MRFLLAFFCLTHLLTSCASVSRKKSPPYVPPTPVVAKKKGKLNNKTPNKKLAQISEVDPTQSLTSPPPVAPIKIDAMDFLKNLVNKSNQAPTKEEQDLSRQQAIEIVESKLNEDQLKEVANNSDFSYLQGLSLFRLGQMSLEYKETNEAMKYLNRVIEVEKAGDLADRAQEIIAQTQTIKNVQPQTIGAVLPLSGKNAPMGQRALRGLELGLGLSTPGSTFKLAVIDSEGNPDSARRGVERLVKEDNVIAIVGSLLSKTGPTVATKANELGVPNIALSQRAGLTEIGPTVFRNSLTSAMQVKTLVRTAMEDLGMKKFAILYPNDAYGVEFTNIFWDEVLARGGKITAIQNYSPKETDFRLVIQRLLGTFFGEARQEEYNLRLKEISQMDKKRSTRQSNMENVIEPITDFDAIFIPDSVKAMGQIAAMLSYSDVKDIKLLGTNLWNTKESGRRAGNFEKNILFVDSVAPAEAGKSRFIKEYKLLYNEEPTLIEIQAYDAGLILRQLIASGANTRENLTQELTHLNKFPGSFGPLTMSPEREIERPAGVLTVEKGEIVPFSMTR